MKRTPVVYSFDSAAAQGREEGKEGRREVMKEQTGRTGGLVERGGKQTKTLMGRVKLKLGELGRTNHVLRMME